MLQNYISSVIISYSQKGISLEKFQTLIVEYVKQIIQVEFKKLNDEGIIGIKDNKLYYNGDKESHGTMERHKAV